MLIHCVFDSLSIKSLLPCCFFISWYFFLKTPPLFYLDLVFSLIRKWAISEEYAGVFYTTVLAEESQCRAAACHRPDVIEVMDWSVLPDAAIIILRAPDRVSAELRGTARSWVEFSLWLDFVKVRIYPACALVSVSGRVTSLYCQFILPPFFFFLLLAPSFFNSPLKSVFVH